MFNINIYCTAGVRKRDGTEYEPDTLTGIQNSIDCHLKNLKSKVDKKKDEQFTHSRKVLEAKRKQLKSQGKGNKKNRAESLDADETKALYEKQLLGAGL
jgi:glycogen synthase